MQQSRPSSSLLANQHTHLSVSPGVMEIQEVVLDEQHHPTRHESHPSTGKAKVRSSTASSPRSKVSSKAESIRKKTSVKEVVSEFESLRAENNSLKDKIEEQQSAIEFLQKATEQREALVEDLKKEVRKLRVISKQEFDMFAEEMKTKQMEDEFKIKTLTIEKSKLESEMHIYKFYEKENAELRTIVKSLHSQLEKMAQVKNVESQTSAAELEKWKKQLELDFNEKLSEMSHHFDYSKKNDSVWEEILQSGIFKETMANRPPSDVSLFLDQVRLTLSQNEKLRKDKQGLEQELLKKEETIRDLQMKLLTEQEKIRLLEEDIYESKNVNADNEILHTELDVMSSELARMTEKYKTSLNEMEKWRSRALTLKHVDIDLTPRKLGKLLEAKEEMIESARNTAKNIKKNVEEEEKPSISVLQALSMWNTNFAGIPEKNNTFEYSPKSNLDSHSVRRAATTNDAINNREKIFNVQSLLDTTGNSILSNLNSKDTLEKKKRKKKEPLSFDEEKEIADKSISILYKWSYREIKKAKW
ncbi:hypothetical protein C9374_006914 [Naegleria lovaniensis]|uniref:Uncharacterized protein n=1 Tax=Naegleria lovaniensis TaxID=51637 RepID=A0AA88KPP4_NAELO|nr:uncharacterized protein C9374_006914 [Naegleria lovaniensis]KAG2393383.1 hypothetical protein C9374_006914 [Naegleria lovaniensis]